MNKGFIKLYRKIDEWEWYKDATTFRLFIHLLIKAEWEGSKFCGIDIGRGQVLRTERTLAEELFGNQTKRQPIRTALQHLVSTQEITIEQTPKGSLITINNYDDYQALTQEVTQEATQDSTKSNPSANHSSTHSKEHKNNKNKNNKKSTKRKFIPPSVDEVLAYCKERNNKVSAEAFVDFYSSKDWMIGKNKMKDWKACVRTWERRQKGEGSVGTNGIKIKSDRDTSLDHIFRR